MPSQVSTQAVLSYLVPPEHDTSGTFSILSTDPTTGVQRRKNVIAQLQNIRGKEATHTLDKCGFQFFKYTSKHTAFSNDDDVIKEYYPESIEFIKKITGASRVELFDHTIERRRHPGQTNAGLGRRQPVIQVQVDQTAASAIARVHKHLPAEDASKLLEKRFQQINLWRPIENPAVGWSLGLCDYRSIDPENDPFPQASIHPNGEEEIMGVRSNPKHEWKYLDGMTTDEIVLFKCFDSVQDGSVARFTPHTLFRPPQTLTRMQPRQFIMLHALVFYD